MRTSFSLVVLIVLGMCVGCGERAISVKEDEWMKEYFKAREENKKDAFDAKYKGKLIRVTGIVAYRGKDRLLRKHGDYCVAFPTHTHSFAGGIGPGGVEADSTTIFSGITCLFQKEEDTANVKEGDNVTVEGRLFNTDYSCVDLEDCRIMK